MKANLTPIKNNHLLLTVCLVWLVLGLTQVSAATIGYWRFEEGTAGNTPTAPNSVLDSSGNGLNLTPFGNLTYSSDLPPWAPQVGSTLSMHFDGSTTRLYAPDTPIVQLTHSLTIEASIKTLATLPGSGGTGQILMRADNRPGLDPYFMTLNGGNVLTFAIDNASDNSASLQYVLPFNQWFHVAGTLDDATGNMKLYVNGNLVASTTTSIRPLGALDPAYSPGLSIGCDDTGQYGEHFNGWLDEVRLSDVALDPSQFLVPEPSAFALSGLAAALLFVRRRCS